MLRTFTFFTSHVALLTGLLLFSNSTVAQQVDNSIFQGIAPRNIGPAGMSGRVTAIDVVLDSPDEIYIGAAAGGIWKSENGGHTWTPIFDNEKTSSIGDIHIYQANPNVIYVGTGEGNPRNSHNSGMGMYKTIDGGRTWSHLGLENTRQIHRVIVHPDNPDIVWAGASGSTWAPNPERGVYKSTDGGKSWKHVLFVDDMTGIADLRMDPSNPNKLIAAMWQHERKPWFFTSGGSGSGIYISLDGGETWEQTDCSAGLPCTELGRIGIAFAPSNSDYVYAFVESKQNAIYRSVDGGFSWEKRSTSSNNIGDRPFYYADLYVDVNNENRVYSIATQITVSEDGGKTWDVFAAGNKIHTDHHAWWAHPDDPNHLMNGNDGGFFITHDRGENWYFSENLPLAQFYHVRVDNEIPYNIYGGLQDNGSWCGPSQTWFKGGIRNMYWQRLSVGDGFDVVPDPLDHQYGYAMGQAGNLVRYHKTSGQLQPIRPIHPEKEYLRFNWNAGIAIDPHDNKTVYYGSQYLHKSSDHGRSWEIISPDLTTNDPEKQEFLESGGLTFDVTGAEFHCSIVSIAPSPRQEGVIWVGTDDGNVQVTRDGGDSWTLCNGGISGPPDNTWVPHIHASSYRDGEAWVVFDDHRRNHWQPYVYRTTDFGASWERVVDSDDVEGFVYTFVQDPVEEDLWFCGTDVGLYYSIDAGSNWNRWTNGYPTTPTRDLVIHPRDGDLVIATFGRSFWILDDIGPLRELARDYAVADSKVHVFNPPNAILAATGESHGYRDGKVGDVLYNGENRPYGALISFVVNDVQEHGDTVDITISDRNGNDVRNLVHIVDKPGIHRVNWDLRRNAPRPPQVRFREGAMPRGGAHVIPGNYTVAVSSGAETSSADLVVTGDPRLDRTADQFAAKDELITEYYSLVGSMTAIADDMRDLEDAMKLIKSRAESTETELDMELYGSCAKELKRLQELMFGKDVQGIYRQPQTITTILGMTGYMMDPLIPVSENQRKQMQMAEQACNEFTSDWNTFRNGSLSAFREHVAKTGLSLL